MATRDEQGGDDAPAWRPRSYAVVEAELREVVRHLAEVPPHHGGGRADLSERADRLRRELARLTEDRA